MKKITLFSLASILGLASASADVTTVKTLYAAEDGSEGTNVTWDTPFQFEASEFAEGVNVGDYLYVTFSATTDVIEVKANGTWLPGSLFTWLGEGKPDYKCYLTLDGLNALREFGLELCGANFTVTGVSICNDGFVMPEGAVWGGFFWVEEWNTMDLWKTAFNNYDGQRYLDIYLSEDNGDNTGYFLKVLTNWDPETCVATNEEIAKTATVATVDLENVNLTEMLEDVDRLMIQGNPEGGNPFNITAVVLRDENSASIEAVEVNAVNNEVYNIQGIKVKNLSDVPAGIYIKNGKKVVVK